MNFCVRLKKNSLALLLGLLLFPLRGGAEGLDEAGWQALVSGPLAGVQEALETASADAVLEGGNRPLHVAAEYASDPGVVALLVRRGASLSAEGLEGLTPLMLAAAYNPNPAIAEALLQAGASLDVRDKAGRTALHLAAASGSPQVTALLLRHGASAKEKDQEGRTPLWLAAARASVPNAELLLDAGAPVDDPNKAGETPLEAACAWPGGQAEILRLLVDAGADANRRDLHRYTPVMRAVAAGADAEALRALVAGKADLLAQDDQNRSAVFLAASGSRTDVMGLLLDAEGTPDPRESSFMTPLMAACRANNLPIVRYLLERGAGLSLRDRRGWTPLMFAAASNASEDLLRLLTERGAEIEDAARDGLTLLMAAITAEAKPETLRTLLDLGADPNRENIQGITPVMLSVADGRTEALRTLLERGADPNLGTWDGLTPLMLAARRAQDPDVFKALMDAGASMNQQSRQGTTALMVAAAAGNGPGVEALISSDMGLRDQDGLTALFHSIQQEDAAIVERLLQAGSKADATLPQTLVTPLMEAALRGNGGAVRALLKAGADPKARDFIQWTPLHCAARGKLDEETLALLIDGAGEVDLRDCGGTTPLMAAAACDNALAVRAFLKAGADPSLTDRTGRDALSYARMRNAKECLPLLEEIRK